jgi:hypothetical protein
MRAESLLGPERLTELEMANRAGGNVVAVGTTVVVVVVARETVVDVTLGLVVVVVALAAVVVVLDGVVDSVVVDVCAWAAVAEAHDVQTSATTVVVSASAWAPRRAVRFHLLS